MLRNRTKFANMLQLLQQFAGFELLQQFAGFKLLQQFAGFKLLQQFAGFKLLLQFAEFKLLQQFARFKLLQQFAGVKLLLQFARFKLLQEQLAGLQLTVATAAGRASADCCNISLQISNCGNRSLQQGFSCCNRILWSFYCFNISL